MRNLLFYWGFIRAVEKSSIAIMEPISTALAISLDLPTQEDFDLQL
jgi:hypothetical protein